jgi:hypothetical protein
MTDTFRQEYTPLSDEQKAQVAVIKENAAHLLSLIDQFVPGEERSERARCVNIGRTNLEQSIMWVVKGLTTGEK